MRGAFPVAVFLCVGALACARPPPPRTTLDRAPPRLASAFFGLDHAMPEASRTICRAAPGADGMPVTFSRRVVGPIDPAVFAVRLRSGALRRPACATTAPANAPAKDHTVLLLGELGGEPTDPPVSVEVTGSLALAGGADARGLSVAVTPLADGPSLVLALAVAPGTIASDCPSRTRTIVVVVWAGGVKPAPGHDASAHRQGYVVTTQAGDLVPFALGDLDDRDNYVHLCLDTTAAPLGVHFGAGLLVDPRGDPNPGTSIVVSASVDAS